MADGADDSVMIGAVPAAGDPIYSASSERVPHITLLFFGSARGADLDAIRTAVAETAQKFKPVTARVLRRTTLGDDKADVLMLDPGDLRAVRSTLLAYSAVRAAHNAIDQYPHWKPHTTLGYPDTPATDEPGRTVTFDRLALWTGDYVGDDFPLGAVPSPVLAAVVRTPAGARKYGQPIGSVIVRDVIPEVKARISSVPMPHKGHKPTSAELAAAVRAVKESPVPRSWPGESGDDDTKTVVYLDAAGYNERPTVLSTAEFDAFKGKTLVNFNHNSRPEKLDEFWRGTEVPRWGTDPYANLTTAAPEEFFVGSGIYSNGTHIGSKTTASMFIAETRLGRSPNKSERLSGGGTLVRIKIHPDARVVQMTDIPNMEMRTPYEIVKWAVDHNYDIVTLYGTRDPVAGVAVLNRSVMVVEELKTALSARPTFAVGSTVEWGPPFKRIQGEVLRVLDGETVLVKPPWSGPPLRMNPRKLIEIGVADENSGRVASAGVVAEPGLDVSAGGADDLGLGAAAGGLPGEGRGGVPEDLGTADRPHRPVVAAGDSWRWQLRDKNGKWIEMGSEVRYLVRGLYRQGIVIGSPSPGMADVHEHITELIRTIPSSRLEVVKSAARVVERAVWAGKRNTDLTDNPALVDLVERAQDTGVSLDDWGEWLIPDEFASLRKDVVAALPQVYAINAQARPNDLTPELITQTAQTVWEWIRGPATSLGFDEDTGPMLARGITVRVVQRQARERNWSLAQRRKNPVTRDLAPAVNDVRKTGQVAIATHGLDAELVLVEGRFMTQFEVANSGGYYDPDYRAATETSMFGIHPEVDPERRTIYGYVFTPGRETAPGVEQYGEVRFILKPEARARTTMSVGDTLGTGAVPVPLDGPDVSDKDAYMASSAVAIGSPAESLIDEGADYIQDYDYFEAQIHDGVTTDDIAEIVITDWVRKSDYDDLVELADGLGITVRFA